MYTHTGWWFGTMKFYDCPFSWECHNPNWLWFLFRGIETRIKLEFHWISWEHRWMMIHKWIWVYPFFRKPIYNIYIYIHMYTYMYGQGWGFPGAPRNLQFWCYTRKVVLVYRWVGGGGWGGCDNVMWSALDDDECWKMLLSCKFRCSLQMGGWGGWGGWGSFPLWGSPGNLSKHLSQAKAAALFCTRGFAASLEPCGVRMNQWIMWSCETCQHAIKHCVDTWQKQITNRHKFSSCRNMQCRFTRSAQLVICCETSEDRKTKLYKLLLSLRQAADR